MTTQKVEFNQLMFERQIKNIPIKYDKNNHVKNNNVSQYRNKMK